MGDKALVIVESPSKAKTIGKILGSKYKVIASVGHVRDLPKSKLGIRIDDEFEPEYISIRGKGDVIKEMKKEAKHASKVYLATDPDREGEAISWHIAHLLGIDEDIPCRIVFNEITSNAIKAAVKNPRKIDKSLVDAQQARRVLDRLVGYQISPILWRKVKRGLSAGRVQSATLKIICDREKLILNFVPEEYWNITAIFEKNKKIFQAKLAEFNNKKITLSNKEETEAVLESLGENSFVVSKVEKKERTRRPDPPFTTSSLQQDASNKLNFYTKKTMMIAQQLYEGIDIKGNGTIGLVSYIRTDSVRISDEAKLSAKDFIIDAYSEKYWGNNVFSNKKKDVQDAHEAIRPSNVTLKPDDIKDSLSKDQYNLYKLIWSRFVASQMSSAVYDAVNAEIMNGSYKFRASGSKLKFDGFMSIYNGSAEALAKANGEDALNNMLPELVVEETLKENDIISEQKFTQPPARFTEASLVKELEEKNIGRPSTYVPIIGTLIDRKYIVRQKKMLVPTDLGFVITDLMEKYFDDVVNADFTSGMEDKLDGIEVDNLPWKKVIADFYEPFEEHLKTADADIEKVVVADEPTGEKCPVCGKDMVLKHGRFGEFIACSGYPECKTTKAKIEKIDVKCPRCSSDIVVRRSKKGKIFYGCSGYPNCNQLYWNKPLNQECPKCGALMTEKKTKTSSLLCSNPQCGYKE